MTVHVLAVILAGGRGRRLGGVDKALVPLNGRPLIQHVIDRLRSQVAEIIINANGDPGRFAGFTVLPDEPSSPLDGPFRGLATAFATFLAQPIATRLLMVPTDTPFLPEDLAARLGDALDGAEAAFATTAEGAHPVISLWTKDGARSAMRRLDAFSGERLTAFLDRCGARPVQFSDSSAFLNINSAADLTEAHKHL